MEQEIRRQGMKKGWIWFVAASLVGIEMLYKVLWSVPLEPYRNSTMKHFLVLVAMIVICGVGTMYNPFWGVLLYYTLALLRPQYLWQWSLPVEWRWSFIAAILVLVGVVLNFRRLVVRTQFNLVIWLMFPFSLLLMFGCLTAYDPVIAQSGGIEYAKILFVAAVTSIILDKLWQIRTLAAMILITLGYLAWEVNSLYFFNGRLDIFHYGYGGLDNNGAGLFIAMGIPFAFAFGVGSSKTWQRIASWGIALLMIHAVMMSFSRGAMIASLIACVWLFLKHRKRLQTIVIATTFSFAVLLLAGQEIRDRFLSTADFRTDGSAHARFESWAAAWHMAWENPILGAGVRNSNAFSHNYGAVKFNQTIHSQFLQIAADSGIPAVLLYIIMILVSWRHLSKSRSTCLKYLRELADSQQTTKTDPVIEQTAAIILGVQGSLLVFIIGGLFLSVELIELPWLLMVVAGVMPSIINHHFRYEGVLIPEPTPQPRPWERYRLRPKTPTAKPVFNPTPKVSTRLAPS